MAGQARCAGDPDSEIKQVVFVLACSPQAIEVGECDDDVASRACHLPFTSTLQRLTVRLGDIEEICSCRRFDFAIQSSVGTQKSNEGHAATCCVRVLSTRRWQA